METKTIIAKILVGEHAFLVSHNFVISRLVSSLVKEFVEFEKAKERFVIAQKKKEEEIYAAYTEPKDFAPNS